MIVSSDGLSAIVNLPRYTGLSGAIVGAHIEDASGANLFDLNPNTMRADGTWLWTFAFTNGSLTAAQVANLIRSGQVVLRVYTATNPSGELAGTFGAAAGSTTFSPPAAPPALPGGTPTDADAARFLTQATFGPTSVASTSDRTSIAYVKQRGFSAWIDEQATLPASTFLGSMPLPFADPVIPTQVDLPSLNNLYWTWWQRSVTAPDQLRQRVAFALSQILVVSTNSNNLNDQPYAVAAYNDVLLNGAFGNFRTLLESLTLNPGMGEFLDMLQNRKATATINPNENYGREIMQLFSIGLYQLYPTVRCNSTPRGLPVATYDQSVITGISRVFTGWTYATSTSNFFSNRVFAIGVMPQSNTAPMNPFPSQHEPGSKKLLNGITLAALPTGTPASVASMNQDLRDALNAVFSHPNVGPFICRQLIQRLVTSNPSPGYVYRASRVFDNNGSGVRGDLKAVIKAILLDYEARTTATLTFPGAGKQQEPILRLAKVLRAFDGKSVSGNWRFTGIAAQVPLNAPTVFNFYAPDYIAPGAIANANLYSPEFDITNESTIASAENTLRSLAFGTIGGGNVANDQTRLNFNLDDTDRLLPLTTDANISALLDEMDLLLMSGQMPATMKSIIITQTKLAVPTVTTVANQRDRLRTIVHLIITSPQFSTQR